MPEAKPLVEGIGGGESDSQESDLVGVSGKAGLGRKEGKVLLFLGLRIQLVLVTS